ncbi:MAG: dephospho-CoA kinase [Elusimicrobiota bacterium]
MPERALRVALTGGIGTGKSEALKAFGRAGAATISLDAVAHELSRKGKPVYRAILKAFGRGFLGRAGEIDRKALGKIVFARPRLRRRLEAASHPPILREMRRRLKRVARPVVVVDVPLLYERGLQREFDVSVVVTAPRRAQLGRVMRRDGVGRAEVLSRLRAQLPMTHKERKADVVIRNHGGLRELRRAVGEYQNAFNLIARSTWR